MRRDSSPLAWINRLTTEEAIQHLADRKLKITGILPVLRARLHRYEEAVQGGTRPRPTPSPGVEATEPLDTEEMLPAGATSRLPMGTGESTPTKDSLFATGGLPCTPPRKAWGKERDSREGVDEEHVDAFIPNDTAAPFDPRSGHLRKGRPRPLIRRPRF